VTVKPQLQTPGVGEEVQAALCGDPGVDLSQRAGGGVARVDVGALAGGFGGGVQRGEVVVAEIDLAADLDHLGPTLPRQAMGDFGDSLQVRRHVFAEAAIAARRALNQDAVLIAQRSRQTVDLGFGGVGDRIFAETQEAAHPSVELTGVVIGEGVIEREHRHAVFDRRKRRGPGGAHFQRRRVLSDQVWETRLDLDVTAFKCVVVAVGDRRGFVLKVAHVVGGQLVGESRELHRRLGLSEALDRRAVRHASARGPRRGRPP
jgi:hypothetical protein